MTLADGLEIHLEPGRADLTPEQVRALVLGISETYRRIRSPQTAPLPHGEAPPLDPPED